MKKVEIEILQINQKETTLTNQPVNQFLGNVDFSSPVGSNYTSTYPGVGDNNWQLAYKNNLPINNNWKTFNVNAAPPIGVIATAQPQVVGSEMRLYTQSTNISQTTISGIYQMITGATPGNQYTCTFEISSLPVNMAGLFLVFGIPHFAFQTNTQNANQYDSGGGVYREDFYAPFSATNMPNGNISVFNDAVFIQVMNLSVGTNSFEFTWGSNPNAPFGVGMIGSNGTNNLQYIGIDEIKVENNSTQNVTVIDDLASTIGRLDLTDSQNFPLSLTYAVADGSNFESIFGDYSKTFKVPATKNNIKLLGHIQNEKIIDSKNITMFKNCRILVDGIEFANGKLKVSSSQQRKDPELFECVFYGGNSDWGSQIKGRRMCDLITELGDGTNTYNLLYDYPDIEATWTLNNAQTDIVYPLVSVGDFYPGGTPAVVNMFDTDASEQDWRAYFYVRNLIKYIFKPTGYRIESDFLDTYKGGWFKRLICQFQWGKNDGDNLSEAATIEYEDGPSSGSWSDINMIVGTGTSGGSSDTGFQPLGSTPAQPGLQFETLITDDFGQFSSDFYTGSATGQITIALDGKMNYDCSINFVTGAGMSGSAPWNSPVGQTGGFLHNSFVRVQRFSTLTGATTTLAQASASYQSGASYTSSYWTHQTVAVNTGWTFVNAGDKIWCEVRTTGFVPGSMTNNSSPWVSGVVKDNVTNGRTRFKMEFNAQEIPIGSRYKLHELMPCSVKQTDFLKGIAHMFNLYFYTDTTKKIVYIEPFDKFYKSPTEAYNWDDKVDYSKPIIDKYNTGLTNEILFKYKKDSNDKILPWYEKQEFKEYPYYSFYYNNVLNGVPGFTTFENPLFTGTLMEYDNDTNGDPGSGDANNIPVMAKEITAYAKRGTPDRPSQGNFGIKILWYNGKVSQTTNEVGFWKRQTGASSFIGSNFYPRAVFVDKTNDTSLTGNLTFAEQTNLSYGDEFKSNTFSPAILLPGLVSRYWSNMLDQLYLSPKVRTLSVNIKIRDILNLDFKRLIYMNGSYWRLIKILEFAPAKDIVTKIECLQWIEAPMPNRKQN